MNFHKNQTAIQWHLSQNFHTLSELHEISLQSICRIQRNNDDLRGERSARDCLKQTRIQIQSEEISRVVHSDGLTSSKGTV